MDKPHILIVDDCPVMCSFYALFLSKKYNAVPLTNPVEALEMVRNGFKPDLIVSDLNMPQLNGQALIRAIRQELPTTPILVVSVEDSREIQRETLRQGANDYLTKPFHPAELSNRIYKQLNSPTPSPAARFFSFFQKNEREDLRPAIELKPK